MTLALAVALPWPVPAWRWGRLLRAVPASPAAGDIDHLVVARARRGDHRAFAQIVDHYDDRLRGLAFRLLGDRDRMDDVLQEAYVKAFRALPRFKGESALGTWLYRIVYNACIDDLRSRKVAVSLDDGGRDTVQRADPRPGPADIAVVRGDLAAALATLPPDQRAAVLLVDAYGLDYDEAGDVLGVATGTIGSRLSRARATLRALLRDNGQ